MPFNNLATRQTMALEKSHSLSFSVRLEDRLHVNIVDELTDTCWFAVRPVPFVVGQADTDLDSGAEPATGVGFKVDGVFYEKELSVEELATLSPAQQEIIIRESRLFLFEVQAAALDLDPEVDWHYAVSYTKDGYSIPISNGPLEIGQNPTNSAAALDFAATGDVYRLVGTIDGRNLINVTATLPMPQDGPAGLSTYYTTDDLSQVVGNTRAIDIDDIILPSGRSLLVGDMIYSSSTTGILGIVDGIDWGVTPASVTVRTLQRFGIDGINALAYANVITGPATGGDPAFTTVITPNTDWTVDKIKIPLPDNAIHEYHVGDLVIGFARFNATPGGNAKLFIGLIKAIYSTQLTVTTKYRVDLLDSDSIAGLLGSKAEADHSHEIADVAGLVAGLEGLVPETRTINGVSLDANVTLNLDAFAGGSNNKAFTAALNSKLTALPTSEALTGLLDAKVTSANVDTILVMTQAAYTALTPKNSRTQYLIVG